MKKTFRKLAVGLAVAGTMAGMIPGVVSPVSAFANEVADISGQRISDPYKVNIINEYQYTEGSEADYPEVSKLVSDKETAAPGETVTITFSGSVGGLPEGRVKVIRSDSGEDVTESVLGEHHSHLNEDKLTFMMPEYDITIKAGIIVGPYESTPVFAFTDKPDYNLACARESEHGKVTVEAESLETSELGGTNTIVKKGDTVHLAAVPDPGYKFKKWYISCPFCNVGITDDMEINTKVDETTGVATADFVQNGDVWIEAEFEKVEGTVAPKIPPEFSTQVTIHINYVNDQGIDITDEVNYSILDPDGKLSDNVDKDNKNTFHQTFGFSPKKEPGEYVGDVDGVPLYKVIYEGSFEKMINIIRSNSLPEQYKPLDDISITTTIGDINDPDMLEQTTIVSSDNENVKIERGEKLSYNIFIPIEKKGKTDDSNGQEVTGKNEDQATGSSTNKENPVDSAHQSRNTPAVTTAGSSVSAAAVPVNTKTTAPATGDDDHMLLYAITAGSSVITAAAAFVLFGRRKKEN